MTTIEITTLSGHSPYDITICDISYSNCIIVDTGVVSAPVTVSIPTLFQLAEEFIILVTDSIGCQYFEVISCVLPPPTPTITPTPTVTPTNISCNCITFINNNPADYGYGYTDCDGFNYIYKIYPYTTIYVCGKDPVVFGPVTFSIGSPCVDNSCPIPSPTPSGTPTPTPTLPPIVGYFEDCCDTTNQFIVADIPFSYSPLSGVYFIQVAGFTGCVTSIGSFSSPIVYSYNLMSSSFINCDDCHKSNPFYICSTPTPTPTSTLTPTPTITISATPTLTPTVTSTITPTPSVTMTLTPTPTTSPLPSFLSVWRTTSPSETITLPYTLSGTYSGIIDWGDSTTSVNSYANRTHTYTTPGDYQVTIYGTINGFRFNNSGDRLKIREVLRWGPLNLGASFGHFWGCSNLVLSGVTDVLNLSTNTTLSYLFTNCSSLTTINNVNSWNVSNSVSFERMFFGCTNFNDDISNWNVSKSFSFESMFRNCSLYNNGLSVGVSGSGLNNWSIKTTGTTINMSRMFESCLSFNQDISNWNVSKVNNLTLTFYNNPYFNQPIGNWERTTPDTSSTSGVTTLNGTFNITGAFNQPINNWNTSNVTNLTNTFYVSVFNQPLSGWNTSNVTTMNGTFGGGAIFNQDISNWNTSNVTTTSGMFLNNLNFNNGGSPNINNWVLSSLINSSFMFYASDFNQPVNSWDVSNVTNMNSMFYSTPFNQPLSGWNVSNVTDMNNMFRLSNFNQPINNWNVSKVTNMDSMFSNSLFNQNIGSWNVSGVTNFTNFMFGKTPATFSTTNLDAIYNGWSSLPSVQSGINITFGSAKYTSGSSSGKTILQTTYGWTITDGGI